MAAEPAQPVDIETLDFYTDRRFVDVLLVREKGRCFYCLRSVHKETCHLDHVMPRVAATDNSYRNIAVSCDACNSQKQELGGDDFLRTLYRRSLLSQPELEERLAAIERLRRGELVPAL